MVRPEPEGNGTARWIRERLRENWRGYVREYWVWLFLAVLAALADMAATIHFMCSAGPEAEEHPAIRLVSMVLGPVLGPILGKLCQFAVVILLTVYLRRYALYIFVTVIILYAWAAWYNVWGCEFYCPRLLRMLEYLPF